MSFLFAWFSGLRGRILAVIAVPLAAVVVVAALALHGAATVSEGVAHLADGLLPITVRSYTAQLAFSDILRRTQAVLLTTEQTQRDSLLTQARASLESLTQSAAELTTVAPGPAYRSVHEELGAGIADLNTLVTPVWGLLAKNNMLDNEKSVEMLEKGLPRVTARMETAMAALVKQRDADALAIRTEASRTAASVQQMLTIVVPAALLAGSVPALLIGQGLYRRIDRIVLRVDAISRGEDELSQRTIAITDPTEMGDLIASFNRFSGSVNLIVSRVDGLTNDVSAGAGQISAASEEMSATLEQQARQVAEISSAVDELARAVASASEASAQASQASLRAGGVADEGDAVVARTITGMDAIREAVSQSASSVDELGKRSEEIGRIISVINDIADQTNLLALNAAIEAARAGEHGRGFAVVADEVRKLADRTTQATAEVAKSVTDIQSQTRQTVERMRLGAGRVEDGVALAGQAQGSLRQIVSEVRSCAGMITSIAAAIEEQRATGDAIRERVAQVALAAKQTAEASSSTAATAQELAAQSATLRETVGGFARAR